MAPVHNARYAKRRRGDEGETAEAPRPPRRTAVLVGVGREIEDAGEVMPALRAHGDVDAIRDLLIDVYGFRSQDITIMVDKDGVKEHLNPTKSNIVKQLKRMVKGARAGDSYFFFYAGHGTQGKCGSETESDGFDEFIKTADGRSIKDNKLHNILVRPLPPGARLVALFDACHAGTMLDLPHTACNSIGGIGLAALAVHRLLSFHRAALPTPPASPLVRTAPGLGRSPVEVVAPRPLGVAEPASGTDPAETLPSPPITAVSSSSSLDESGPFAPFSRSVSRMPAGLILDVLVPPFGGTESNISTDHASGPSSTDTHATSSDDVSGPPILAVDFARPSPTTGAPAVPPAPFRGTPGSSSFLAPSTSSAAASSVSSSVVPHAPAAPTIGKTCQVVATPALAGTPVLSLNIAQPPLATALPAANLPATSSQPAPCRARGTRHVCRRRAPASPLSPAGACDGLCDPGAAGAGPLVVSLGASADDELSFETGPGGLMTSAFVEILRARGPRAAPSYQELMVELRARFASMYRERLTAVARYRGLPDFNPEWEMTQRPQLSSLHPLDLKQPLLI